VRQVKNMYNKILVPLDGSKLSECSLDHVVEVASGCHVSEVILLTANKQYRLDIIESGDSTRIKDQFQKREEDIKLATEAAEKYLGDVSEDLKKRRVNAQSVVILAEENQSVAEAIMNYAESNNIDLIVMSTHGRSGITRWAFGSVADRVVRHSTVPVLIVAPAGCRLETA